MDSDNLKKSNLEVMATKKFGKFDGIVSGEIGSSLNANSEVNDAETLRMFDAIESEGIGGALDVPCTLDGTNSASASLPQKNGKELSKKSPSSDLGMFEGSPRTEAVNPRSSASLPKKSTSSDLGMFDGSPGSGAVCPRSSSLIGLRDGSNNKTDRFCRNLSCGSDTVQHLGPGVYHVVPPTKEDLLLTWRSNQLTIAETADYSQRQIGSPTPIAVLVNSVRFNVAEHQDAPRTEEIKSQPIEDSSPESVKIPLAVPDTLDATIVEEIARRRKGGYLCASVLALAFVGIVGLVVGFATGGIDRIMKPKDVPMDTGTPDNEEDATPIIELAKVDGEGIRGQFGSSMSMSHDGTRLAVADHEKVQVFEVEQHGNSTAILTLLAPGIYNMHIKDLDASATNEMYSSPPQGLLPLPLRSPTTTKISANGEFVAVGWPLYDHHGDNGTILTNIGMVEVYRLVINETESSWQQLGNSLLGSDEGDFFGASLSLSEDGSVLAVGAPGSPDHNGGYALVYSLIRGVWESLGSLVSGNEWDLSVYSVSLSGEGRRVSVGGIPASEGAVARVFEWSMGDWIEKGSGIGWTIGNTAYLADLSADGMTIVVSNYYITDAERNTGMALDVRAYGWSDTTGDWEPLGTNMHAFYKTPKSGYFVSLSQDGSLLVMGDPGRRFGDNAGTGHAHLFVFDGQEWVQLGSSLWGDAASDQYGYTVSISGNGQRFAVGAPYNRGSGEERGRVSVYEFPQLGTEAV